MVYAVEVRLLLARKDEFKWADAPALANGLFRGLDALIDRPFAWGAEAFDAAFTLGLGVVALGVKGLWLPVPVQFPMLLFGIFGSFVQALVFTMLAASYIAGVVAEHGDQTGDH